MYNILPRMKSRFNARSDILQANRQAIKNLRDMT